MRYFRSLLIVSLLLVAACGKSQARQDSDAALVTRLVELGDAGNAEASYHAGMLYHLGIEAPKDRKLAFRQFKLAADQGDPLGAYKLGCYYAGDGGDLVTPDPVLALKFKTMAAEAGYMFAQYDVGLMQRKMGNTKEALAWFKKAAAQGDTGSLVAITQISVDPSTPFHDLVLAYSSFSIAASLSDGRNEAEGKQFLQKLRANMSAQELEKAEALVRSYRPVQTPLTEKAMQGIDRAKQVAAGPH